MGKGQVGEGGVKLGMEKGDVEEGEKTWGHAWDGEGTCGEIGGHGWSIEGA